MAALVKGRNHSTGFDLFFYLPNDPLTALLLSVRMTEHDISTSKTEAVRAVPANFFAPGKLMRNDQSEERCAFRETLIACPLLAFKFKRATQKA